MKEWVYFKEITLSGLGKLKASDFVIKLLENKKPYDQERDPKFLFSFD